MMKMGLIAEEKKHAPPSVYKLNLNLLNNSPEVMAGSIKASMTKLRGAERSMLGA